MVGLINGAIETIPEEEFRKRLSVQFEEVQRIRGNISAKTQP